MRIVDNIRFQSRNRETYDSNSTLFEPLLGLL